LRGTAGPRFASVVLDVDSTLCGIEGIDWLAQKRGEQVASSIAAATARAMRGEIALEEIYSMRLSLVRPGIDDVAALSAAYESALAPGAAEAIREWLDSGIRVDLVSGGIRNAILPVAGELGLTVDSVHAVDLIFDSEGNYLDFDRTSPLATAMGKREIISMLLLPEPALAAGDGSTDLAMREAVSAFAAFTGFANRPSVTQHADFIADSFDALSRIVYFAAPP
jgi:phosphoserine phosphatase